MKIEGDLNYFTVETEESAAGVFTETKVVIAENIITGNALLIKKIDWDEVAPKDIPGAGNVSEWCGQQLTRKSAADLLNLEDDDLIALHNTEIYGDATDMLGINFNKYQNPTIFGAGEKDGELYPYKYMYHSHKSSNAAALGKARARVWYYPVTLTKDEMLEITQEAIING